MGTLMSISLDLNDQNKVTVMLMQALLGVISPNFRAVALSFEEPNWQVCFVLETENAVDREEIEDLEGEFSALLMSLAAYTNRFDIRVVVSVEPIPDFDPSLWRLVYLRRES
jgi:hypothetical protein